MSKRFKRKIFVIFQPIDYTHTRRYVSVLSDILYKHDMSTTDMHISLSPHTPDIFCSAFIMLIELVRELVITNMHIKCGKNTLTTFHFKWSCPQVNVNDDANADDAEVQLQYL